MTARNETHESRAVYDRIAALRNKRWQQQDHQATSLGMTDNDEQPSPEADARTTWWFYQGAVEALAECMSILESHGLADVELCAAATDT